MGFNSDIDDRVHTDMARGELAIFKTTFSPLEGSKPRQTQKIQVPEKVSLPDLHLTLTLHLTEYKLQQSSTNLIAAC